jgi:type I restriction enzyme S subunit
MSKGTNTKYLTLELLNRILIPVPPAELQREYERRMAAIDRLRADYNASLERLDMLLASLQHCFFVDQL